MATRMQPVLSSIGRIIAVTSCKGGVGKSTVSVGVAKQLAARGHRVGLYDADVHGPSLPSQVPVGDRTGVSPSEDGWAMVPLVHDGIPMMSFGWFQDESGEPVWGAAEVDPRGGRGGAAEASVQLLHTTAWGELDYLIIDTPPSTGTIPMALAARGHLAGAVVVTTPSKLAAVDVVRGVSMLGRFAVPVVAVVENMASFRCGACGTEHFPFGRGHLKSVLASIAECGGDPNLPSFRLPIISADEADDSLLAPELDGQLDALALSLEQSTSGREVVELPQLAWHERPNWPDKLYHSGSARRDAGGAAAQQESDREFKFGLPSIAAPPAPISHPSRN